MLAQSNELKIVFTADRNVLQSHPPPTHSISHDSYTRHYHHKEHTKVKKQSILSYPLVVI